MKISRFNFNFKKIVKIFLTISIISIIAPIILYIVGNKYQTKNIYNDISDLPKRKVAIVFGAGVSSDNTPSPILRDRLKVAIDLFKSGKVEKIIMSGDNRFKNYNEPEVMINYAIENGIPRKDLQPDYAGRRTYDTCIRAKLIFGLNEAILITQSFHLTRALYTCNSLGINSIGIPSDLSSYPDILYLQTRDIFAYTKAILDINIINPEVVLGEEIEI